MKIKILSTIAASLIISCSLLAEGTQESDEITLLRQEIQKQELILKALQEELAKQEERQQSNFEISVNPEGLQRQGRPISIQELEKELKDLPDNTKMLIRAEPAVALKKVMSIMELCKKAGLKNVAFATTKAEPVGPGQPMKPARKSENHLNQ